MYRNFMNTIQCFLYKYVSAKICHLCFLAFFLLFFLCYALHPFLLTNFPFKLPSCYDIYVSHIVESNASSPTIRPSNNNTKKTPRIFSILHNSIALAICLGTFSSHFADKKIGHLLFIFYRFVFNKLYFSHPYTDTGTREVSIFVSMLFMVFSYRWTLPLWFFKKNASVCLLLHGNLINKSNSKDANI